MADVDRQRHRLPLGTSSLRRLAWVALAFTVLTIAFTWPLARHLADAIPGDAGDPLLNASTLGWDAESLRHGLRRFWEAPIFYPYHDTLAFSEHTLGIAIFVAPLFWATGNPLIAHNVAFLASFVLAGVGMFALARELTGRDDAAWVAALIFAFTPARLGHISHLQVLMSGWMPLALAALHRYVCTTSVADLAALVACVLAQALSNNYFIYFLALPVAAVAVHGIVVADPSRRLRIVVGLAAAAAVIVAALTPIAVVYFRVRREYGFKRTIEDVTNFGADLGTYLHGNEAVHHPLTLWRILPSVFKPAGSEGELFLGASALALAGVAIWVALRRWNDPALRLARLYAAVVAIALVLSLGAAPTAWGVPLPIGGLYRVLFDVLPGFDGLRVPARIAVVVQLGIAALGAFAMSWLLQPRSRAAAVTMVGAVSVAIWLEGFGAPLPLAAIGRGGRTDRGAYDWIHDHAPGPLIELPTGDAAPLLQPFMYEYQTLFHRQRIVNGSSGYDSMLDSFLGGASSPFVEFERFGEGIKLLQAIGVNTILVHPKSYLDPDLATQTVAALETDSRVAERVTFPGVVIFRLRRFDDNERPEWTAERRGRVLNESLKEIPSTSFTATSSVSPDRLPFAFDKDLETRWLTPTRQQGGEFVELAFDRPHDVARLRLLTSDRSFGDYPRRLAIAAINRNGASETLFDGPVVFQLGLGLVRDPTRGPIDIWLPPNRTTRLRVTQTASTRVWLWAIDELSVWEPQ